ncbi:hypothetical protein PZH42_30230, partial [Bacteroides cellulosilyticus]
MYNNSLSQIVDERTLDIHVIPLYWQTWWFRLVVFIIIMSITFFVPVSTFVPYEIVDNYFQ